MVVVGVRVVRVGGHGNCDTFDETLGIWRQRRGQVTADGGAIAPQGSGRGTRGEGQQGVNH